MPMASRMSCLCHSSCGGRTASPPRKTSQMVSHKASRRVNRRDSGSKIGGAGSTQLPSNRRRPSAVNHALLEEITWGDVVTGLCPVPAQSPATTQPRSEEHTSELQSLRHVVCRLLLEKKI